MSLDWIHLIASVADRTCPDIKKEFDRKIDNEKINKAWDGRSRSSISATIVYIVTRLSSCPKKIDIKTIMDYSGVKRNTIKACYRDMIPVIDYLLDKIPEKIVTKDEIFMTFRNNDLF